MILCPCGSPHSSSEAAFVFFASKLTKFSENTVFSGDNANKVSRALSSESARNSFVAWSRVTKQN